MPTHTFPCQSAHTKQTSSIQKSVKLHHLQGTCGSKSSLGCDHSERGCYTWGHRVTFPLHHKTRLLRGLGIVSAARTKKRAAIMVLWFKYCTRLRFVPCKVNFHQRNWSVVLLSQSSVHAALRSKVWVDREWDLTYPVSQPNCGRGGYDSHVS
eukprot:3712302-Amphidinium_carterae.1